MHERLVDLEGVDRYALQITQTRIAGAEVVYGERHTQRLERLQHHGGRRGVVHEQAFGQFEFEILRRHAGLLQDQIQSVDKALAPELHGGNIDRHGHRGQAGVEPGADLPAGLAQHPLADRHDEAALLRDRNELRRQNKPERRVIPADQNLAAGHGPADEVDLRLVMQHELVLLHGAAQVVFDHHALDGAGIHVALEELVIVASQFLGVVHRRIGVLHHRLHGAAVVGIDADADAEADMDFVPVDEMRRGDGNKQLFGDMGRILRLLDVGQQDDELVAAVAADRVRRAHAGHQPRGD